ncbi:Carboxylesterase [Stigmatella aurantiaca DW4/3-1]|uniref:Carboxylesterase n=1 Tax=Stigmatella aurantiaca (strain DW4/3-1) TaxID=378806 RepID=E3FD74_STIAD|nr:Carboxylesterase [Stigmatella aurantiaca DW4/3-1]
MLLTLLAAELAGCSSDKEILVPEPPSQQVQVTGVTVQGSVADGVLSFKGIPFAAPPVGNLRWRAPNRSKPGAACGRQPPSATTACKSPSRAMRPRSARPPPRIA